MVTKRNQETKKKQIIIIAIIIKTISRANVNRCIIKEPSPQTVCE